MPTLIIPAYQPDEKLKSLVNECRKLGFASVIAVDDGSDTDKKEIFDALEKEGCTVLRHEKNLGKGEAIKTALRYAAKNPDCDGIVTADADGQHRPEDILKVSKAMLAGRLTLGVRDLSAPEVPARSKIGNKFSSAFFRLITGVSCPDTQTGLRAIPADLFDTALETEGARYEYEMNMLTAVADKKIPIDYVTIETVYENKNEKSHFRPVRDSLIIYKGTLKFAASSITCSALDLGLFTVINSLLTGSENRILLATVAARLVSGMTNFLLNKNWSFKKKGRTTKQLIKYAALFFAQMFTSSALVQLISFLPIHDTVCKILVDVPLFFASFAIQRRWVYRED